jgi:hypothetical protein
MIGSWKLEKGPAEQKLRDIGLDPAEIGDFITKHASREPEGLDTMPLGFD